MCTEKEELEIELMKISIEERKMTLRERNISLSETSQIAREREASIMINSATWPNGLRSIGDFMMVEDMAKNFGCSVSTLVRNIFVSNGSIGFNSVFYISEFNKSGIWSTNMSFEVADDGDDKSKVRAVATVGELQDALDKGETMYSQWVTEDYVREQGWFEINNQWKSNFIQMAKYASARMFIKIYCPQIMHGGSFTEDLKAIVQPAKTVKDSSQSIASEMDSLSCFDERKEEK